MGNLLGSPITTKDTHVGKTHYDSSDGDDSKGRELDYGISSMQGWRIHMEDAHIAQPFLFAERLVGEGRVLDGGESSDTTSGNKEGTDTSTSTATPPSTNSNATYSKIPLANHSLFACFDGHGGSFAAEYASRNLLRILSRQPAFIAYAERWNGREAYFDSLKEGIGEGAAGGEQEGSSEKVLDDRERLNRLLERGKESDEKVKQIKERVQRHLDGEDVSGEEEKGASEEESKQNETKSMSPNSLEYAKAAYDHELMLLLEYALCDAFCDVDAEILREVRGMGNVDANMPFGQGYCPHKGAVDGVGHLPKEADFEEDGKDAEEKMNVDNAAEAAEASRPPCLDDEDSGTTAIVVMLTPKWIVCANAGDSRAIYSRSNHRAVPLSYDHKPDDEEEERRIREAGGYVSGGRVEGDLAVSRGLGDFRFKDMEVVLSGARGENRDRRSTILDKEGTVVVVNENTATLPMGKPGDQKVSPVPDIIVQNRHEEEDEFIVIACDGIWDVQTNQECVQMAAEIFAEGESDMGLVCEEILDLCLIKGSKDNMTAAVIKFPKQSIGAGGGVTARRERRGASDESAGEQNVKYVGLQRSPTPNPYIPRQPAENDGERKPL